MSKLHLFKYLSWIIGRKIYVKKKITFFYVASLFTFFEKPVPFVDLVLNETIYILLY